MDRFRAPLDRERYCSEKAAMIMESMGRIFEDLRSKTGEDNGHSADTSINGTSPDIISRGSSMKRIENTIFVKRMEADALRRAIEINQQDMKSLEEERRNQVLLADQAMSVSSTLPSLPEEIIAMIFSQVYFTEFCGDRWDESTVNRILNNEEAPSKLKELVRRGIPNVVYDNNAEVPDIYMDCIISDILGPCPRYLSTEILNESDARTEVSVVIRTRSWPSADQLQSLCRVRWKRLFMSYEPNNDRIQRDFIFNLLQKPEVQRKLSELEYLAVPVAAHNTVSEDFERPLTPNGRHLTLESRLLNVEEATSYPRLRTAALPLPALVYLRPILSQVTDLEVTIQPYMKNLNFAIDAIRPLSSNLANLTIWGPREVWSSHRINFLDIEQNLDISFPSLTRLKLGHVYDKNSRDVLSVFQFPKLEEICVKSSWHGESEEIRAYEANKYVTADFLHVKAPLLKCLHIFTVKRRGMQMLKDLAQPHMDRGGIWLLPRLESIVLDSVRGPILKTLTEVVVNRMRSQSPVSRILSVTVPGFDQRFRSTLQNAYLSTLNLYVPEVRIAISREFEPYRAVD